jgi:peptidoglycan hydrolase-like protein with peptidoglycan-binding domain
MFTRLTATFGLLATLALPALADTGAVLIVANEDYQTLRDPRGAAAVLQAERALVAAGFRVDVASDLSANALRGALSALSERLRSGADERVVIVFAGYTVSADHGAWLLGTEARSPDVATVEGFGVRLETLLALAGQLQGGAVVAVADFGFPETPRPGFRAGLPPSINVPQGVTLVRGPGASVAAFLRDMATPGVNLGRAATARAGLMLEGFNPPHLTYLPADHQPLVDADRTAWGAAVDANTVEGYDAYLAAWPNGLFVDQAQAARAQLLNTPERIEEALALTRDERRAIQRDLAILGFDPRGVDGIFGRGTRTAITAWQGANRFAQTGFVNRDQIFELAQQGARRAAQLEAEARARAQELERQDRAFWRDTGSGADEAGMRAYLGRFPEGIFASIARDRLAQIEAERRAAEAARDRAGWDIARGADTVAAYETYLRDFPAGAFADQARARIRELTEPVVPPVPGPDLDAARAAEAALPLPPFLLHQVEARLVRLGYDPGRVDGVLDRRSRRAIEAFQRDRGVQATGYLTLETLGLILGTGLDLLR